VDLKVEKNSFFDCVLLFITLFANCEILYNHTGVSGYYSIYVSFILFIAGFIYLILKNNGNIKISIIAIFCIIPIVLYNFCTESIRYGIFFLTLLTWSNIKFKSLKKFHKFIVILAVIFCLIQKVSMLERISGFMISPTIFSCVLVISLIYFLFEKDFKKSNWIYILFIIILIYFSESSSTFLFSLALIIYKIGINFIISKKTKKNLTKKENNNSFLKILIFLLILGCTIYISMNLNQVLSIISRGNRDASTSTRLTYYSLFFHQLITNPRMFLIGMGAGYTRNVISSLSTVMASHYPLHQDILMILCEYGVLGFICLYNVYFKKLKMNWIIILLIILCSFHNLILSTTTLCLIILTSNSLNYQYNEGEFWR